LTRSGGSPGANSKTVSKETSMKRCLIALIAVALSLTTGVGLATAAVPSTGIQTAGQSASSGQAAGAAAGAAQTNPSNTNISIRVLSPGSDGSVDQSNTVDSDASASNKNSADQDATQSQSAGSTGACCGSGSTGVQSSSQSAANKQAAAALSLATQTGASNTNVPIRVLSPGSDGSVSQSNTVDSDASASNKNSADQDATQTQSGGSGTDCKCQDGSTGIQTSDQDAKNKQTAVAASEAKQIDPKNTNVSIRVLSPGKGGDVTQTNSVSSDANARNSNDADQTATQTQSAGSGPSSSSSDCKCHDGSTGVQTSDQSAKNEQGAIALSGAEQKGASNTNASIRVLSPGKDGDVWQTNSVDSDAKASNRNSADQDATQTQSGSGSGTGVQVSDQDAKSEQAALAASIAKQDHPSNTNTPIRVLSPGKGGDVVQTNSVESDATAKNSNDVDQTADQTQRGGSSDCKCHDGSTGIQTSDQSSKNAQLAIGFSAAEQKGAKNSNSPIRVGSYGSDGDVWQTNSVDSDASARNKNDVDQEATQTQGAGSGSATGIQVSDQSSKNEQAALAASIAKQDHAKNDNSPIRVLSPGKGGKVVQTNSVDSDASAKNSNDVDQTATQEQSAGRGDCKCHGGATGIQISDQSAKSEQLALGFSAAEQKGAKNSNDPLRVKSYGSDGDVWQTNSVDSDAKASNKNDVDQDATQTQSAGSGSGLGIQVSNQESKNAQAALAASIAKQDGAKNDNSPIRVLSPGKGGKVVQTNSVDSDASAKNSNDVDQTVDQTQRDGASDCKCHGSTGIQVAGQSSKNEQFGLGLSAAIQKDASNKNDPIRVKSWGSDGDVWQTNSVDSDARASNRNHVDQDATQTQSAGSGSGLGIQVAGQEAKNHQGALAFSAALQDGASNENKPLRVLSPGRDGNVYQSNSVDSDASASNRNKVDQDVTQTQRGGSGMCGCHDGIGIQVAGQSSWNGQASLAASFAEQKAGRSPCGCPSGASNVNDPARILSPGKSGSVWQSNSVDSNAKGRNSNHADQSADQSQAGAGAQLGIQVAGQEAKNEQLALVLAAALQHAPKNASGPLSVLSPGRGGSTSQSNDAAAKGYGANRNRSGQGATQRQM
jgi:hypothetical protein